MRAIMASQKALEVFSLKDSPMDFGEAKGSLWLAYLMLADIEYRAENCVLALQACEEGLHSLRIWGARPLQIASCCKDLAMTAISLANNEITTEAKAEDCKKAISACEEALQIYDLSSDVSDIGAEEYAEECAEAKILLWAAYSALAEVVDRRENCRRAIEACRQAIAIYNGINPVEHADALKSLGCSYITMAEMEEREHNCRMAIDACKQAMQYYTVERAPSEHADILWDLAFDYMTLSEVQDREECSKEALIAYKKALKIYKTLAEELERNSEPGVQEMHEKAERCHLSMQSCKAVLKAGRKSEARAGAASVHIKKNEKRSRKKLEK
jgi:tetratricopeptide (TPR) repeat protein